MWTRPYEMGAAGLVTRAGNGRGILIDGGSHNEIGGVENGRRNIISGNHGAGVTMRGTTTAENTVLNNFIGVDHTGKAALGNHIGITIDNAISNTIGGPDANAGNVIAGNALHGISIVGTSATGNWVLGNFIGTDATAQIQLPNEDGVHIVDASNNSVGEIEESGASPPVFRLVSGNVIAYNRSSGVYVHGNTATGNSIRGNAIFANGQLGIDLYTTVDLGGRRVTANDSGDAATDPDTDTGPNHLFNFPVAVSHYFDGQNTVLSGLLHTTNPNQSAIDIYSIDTPDGSRFGEGATYITSTIPTQSGDFRVVLPGFQDLTYVSATATGADGSTSEFSPVCSGDQDEDGLCDDWETNGLDFNGDGKSDLDLHRPPFWADPGQKDIFVEIDYMDCNHGGGDCKGNKHTHRPQSIALRQVIRAFANAPVPNPNGQHGINLHLIGGPTGRNLFDEALVHFQTIWFLPPPANVAKFDQYKLGAISDNPCINGSFGRPHDRMSSNCRNILGAWRLVFRYAIYGHDVADKKGATGYSEAPGNDFMVALGSLAPQLPPIHVEAGTFMHELGHTLGLCHGGPLPIGGELCNERTMPQETNKHKPNYLSVMNYTFQTKDIVPDRPLDYSRWKLNTLVESNLKESDGIDGGMPPLDLKTWPTTAFSYLNVANGRCEFKPSSTTGGIDWNLNKIIENRPMAANTGIDDPEDPQLASLPCRQANSLGQVLESAEDWPHLFLHFRSSIFFADGAPLPEDADVKPELTVEMLQAFAEMIDYDDDGLSNADDNCPAVANLSQADGDGDGIGDACAMESLLLDGADLSSEKPIIGSVVLLLPAPPGGAHIELFSSDPAVTTPFEVTIPAGGTTIDFAITISTGVSTTPVAITALYGEDTEIASLRVQPTVGSDLYLPILSN